MKEFSLSVPLRHSQTYTSPRANHFFGVLGNKKLVNSVTVFFYHVYGAFFWRYFQFFQSHQIRLQFTVIQSERPLNRSSNTLHQLYRTVKNHSTLLNQRHELLKTKEPEKLFISLYLCMGALRETLRKDTEFVLLQSSQRRLRRLAFLASAASLPLLCRFCWATTKLHSSNYIACLTALFSALRLLSLWLSQLGIVWKSSLEISLTSFREPAIFFDFGNLR